MRRSAWCTAAITYIPGEFDDYIATPKDNFYRSMHTAVIGPEGKPVEVQIRTREMHDQAELGLAAHWRYKEGARARRHLRPQDRLGAPAARARPAAAATTRDFLDEVRAELFEDRVYALTPKGEVVDLPPGATPLDFAYHVHTDLGHRCRGARVERAHRAADSRAGQWRDRRDHHAQASAAEPRLAVRDRRASWSARAAAPRCAPGSGS